MRIRSLAYGIAIATLLIQSVLAAPDDSEVVGAYFVNLRQFATRCASSDITDNAWCNGYIAGVVDTIGSSRRLQEDQQNARCLHGKRVALSQVRAAVMKGISGMLEDKNSILLNSPAMGSVVAGVVVYLCE